MVPDDGSPPVYVGRLGLTDRSGARLLVDWRSPAAEPFFGATHATPMGLASRRRYRWTGGRVTDYWDEVFTADGLEGNAALDDQSAFIASLGGSRSGRMRDVLGTIQADQDAIVRAGSRGALVVDGGPGTGKTVVALHRTAYLLYSDPRLGDRRGGVLFVGPHEPYLAYVGDVLPSLGEEGVRTCTLRDLVPVAPTAGEEGDPEVARLKSTAAMVGAIEPAVALYEEPPTEGMEVETPWVDLWLSAADWAEAFGVGAGLPHNEARDQVWEELLTILVDKVDDEEVPAEQLRRGLAQVGELREAFTRAWPLLEATDLVGDLWEVPAYLRRCAPWLSPEEVRALQRPDPRAWTVSDLPLLDAARQRLGDPAASARKQRQDRELAAEREEMASVVDHLVATDDTEMQVMSMLRVSDAQSIIVDATTSPRADPDVLAGPFAHVVVDEAQELTDAEWQMLLLRCPSRSFTIVGDRAQARHGFAESWRGAAGPGRPRPGRAGAADDQLPDAGGGDGRGGAGDPRRDPRRQRPDLDPPGWRARRARPARRPRLRARRVAGVVPRGDRVRHRPPGPPRHPTRPFPHPHPRQGPRVRPRRPRRPRLLRRRDRGRRGPLRRDDPRHRGSWWCSPAADLVRRFRRLSGIATPDNRLNPRSTGGSPPGDSNPVAACRWSLEGWRHGLTHGELLHRRPRPDRAGEVVGAGARRLRAAARRSTRRSSTRRRGSTGRRAAS